MESMLYVNGEFLCDSDDIIDPIPDNVELTPCPICSRTFAPCALDKHVGICEKMHEQKRTPFDSFRQRREGTTLETYLPSNYGSKAKPKVSKLSPADSKSISRSISSVCDAPSKLASHQITSLKPEVRLSTSTLGKESPFVRRSITRRTLNPINEICQHCGRSFGSRAFDRHVEWCREKQRITQPTMSAQQHLAKERMQARTKYKAPSLRSKRDFNREKYSSSLSESMNNISDSGGVSIMDFNSVADPYERGRKSSILSLSMTSSIASDGGFSDKYDPFISAKRQLEDLFNVNSMVTSTPQKSSVAAMSTSLNAKSPSSPTKNQNLSKSNFRRSSSLRVPSKKTSPISYMPKYKPTIQRGISDEGPISSNFLKPEEYDELPVKSHAVIPPDLVPKSPKPRSREPSTSPIVVKRDQSSARRRNVCAELKNASDFPLTKTDSLAAFLKFEDDLECMPTPEENMSEKELKDKSNNLNKKSLTELIDNKVNDSNEFGSDRLPTIKSRLQCNPVKLEPIDKPLIKNKIVLEPLAPNSECNNNIRIDDNENSIDSNLINSCDNLRLSNLSKLPNESSSFDQTNDCVSEATDASIDNHLVTNTSNFSTRDSSSADSMDSHQNMELIVNLKNINDTDKRNPKRQMQLQKNSLLFDNAITIRPVDDSIGEVRQLDDNSNDNHKHSTILSNDSSPKSQKASSNVDDCNEINRKLSARNMDDFDKFFDDFDLEEFISSFSDNEQFPIFKNYKEMISSTRVPGRSHDSESTSEESEFDDKIDVSDIDVSEKERTSSANSSNDHYKKMMEVRKDERPLKKPDVTAEAEKRMQIESERKHSGQKHAIDTKMSQLQEIMDESGEMSQAERELLASVQELNSMCDDTSSLDLTSDVMDSKSDCPPKMEALFKSLFLRSSERADSGTTRFSPRNRHQPILSYQMPEIVGFSSHGNKELARIKTAPSDLPLKPDSIRPLSKDTKLNASLNGFDRVLPPIVMHKNDSQNIYNTINMASSYHEKGNRDSVANRSNDRKLVSSMSLKGKDTPNFSPLKLSKFCHECGTKFIVDQAKFCMDCGVKRPNLD